VTCGFFALILFGLSLLVPHPRTLQADAAVLLSSSEPLTVVVGVPDREPTYTLSLDSKPVTLEIPLVRYCSGFRFAWDPPPPPLVRLQVQVGDERYRIASYGHQSLWFVEDAVTAVEVREGESAHRLSIGTIETRADAVWVLPVRVERNADVCRKDGGGV
jgi:hypothetical protein